MKVGAWLLATAWISGAASAAAAPAEPRQVRLINADWRYFKGDPAGADRVTVDERDWQTVNLPHSFSMPYFAASQFYTGYGWYRKQLDLPKALSGKRVFLEFDGVFQVAELFVNGKAAGEHRGGYTGFSLDVTPFAKPGRNVIAVRVNNLWNPRQAPRSGEHVFSGGIYRNVRLVITSDLHIPWYGTSVTTPGLTVAAGRVNVKTEVRNASEHPRTATVVTQIIDPEGRKVAETTSTQRVPAGTVSVFDQTSPPVRNPRLWSPDHPTLYSVRTLVREGTRTTDTFRSPLGFRWFTFTKDRGFFLNGSHYYFKGANVHQDHAGWGDAVADSAARRDLQMIKDAGFDFVRGSHYPHAPAFSRACDELGLLFWSENCFWGLGGNSGDGYWNSSAYPIDPADEADFEASVKQSLREMIRIHRNHPSIIVWSMSNEPFFSEWKVMPKVRTLLTSLVALTHELDPTRPAAVGGCQRGDLDLLGEVAGYNGDGARLFVKPEVASVVSEYGSTIADRPGEYAPGWGDLPTTPGANPDVPGSWRFPWRSGEAIWCGFDHGSIAGRAFGAMGLVDYFRLPKRQWYWYRNEYRHIPSPTWPTDGTPAKLGLAADRTVVPAVNGTEDTHVIVTVEDATGKALSNSVPVTLTITSGPGEFPTGRSITFRPDSDITIRDGQAAIEMRAYAAGDAVIRATSPGLESATLKIVFRGGPKFVPGVTPLVADRPYTRFVSPSAPRGPITLGLGNPTRCSSEVEGHEGRRANDGFESTTWQPLPTDADPWLQIDLEKIATVRAVTLTLSSGSLADYAVEISYDGRSDWRSLARSPVASAEAGPQTLKVSGSFKGRFVRIRFTRSSGTPVGISEVGVTAELGG